MVIYLLVIFVIENCTAAIFRPCSCFCQIGTGLYVNTSTLFIRHPVSDQKVAVCIIFLSSCHRRDWTNILMFVCMDVSGHFNKPCHWSKSCLLTNEMAVCRGLSDHSLRTEISSFSGLVRGYTLSPLFNETFHLDNGCNGLMVRPLWSHLESIWTHLAQKSVFFCLIWTNLGSLGPF